MEVKTVNSTDLPGYYFLGIDSSRRDCSHLLFTLDFDSDEFFSDFVGTKLIQCQNVSNVHDSTGLLVDESTFFNFTVDSFGGLYYRDFCLTLSNSNSHNVVSNEEKILQQFADFQLNSIYKDHKFIKEPIKYKKLFNGDKDINLKNEEDLSDPEEDGLSSSDSSDLDFGTAKFNGTKQKLYKFNNKRKLIEKINKEIFEIPQDEENLNLEVNHNEEEREYRNFDLDYLYTMLDEQLNLKK